VREIIAEARLTAAAGAEILGASWTRRPLSILRNTVWFFGALALFAVAAFWPTSLSRMSAVEQSA